MVWPPEPLPRGIINCLLANIYRYCPVCADEGFRSLPKSSPRLPGREALLRPSAWTVSLFHTGKLTHSFKGLSKDTRLIGFKVGFESAQPGSSFLP